MSRRDELDNQVAYAEQLKGALEEMVWQFGNTFSRDRRRFIGTMGLSALESAFEALGWDDPHDVTAEGDGCQWPGCDEWISCGLNTSAGYKSLCSTHGREIGMGSHFPLTLTPQTKGAQDQDVAALAEKGTD